VVVDHRVKAVYPGCVLTWADLREGFRFRSIPFTISWVDAVHALFMYAACAGAGVLTRVIGLIAIVPLVAIMVVGAALQARRWDGQMPPPEPLMPFKAMAVVPTTALALLIADFAGWVHIPLLAFVGILLVVHFATWMVARRYFARVPGRGEAPA
jgi:hypothetical protein